MVCSVYKGAHLLSINSRRAGIPPLKAPSEKAGALWKYVIPHFEQFLGELELRTPERLDAEGKADRIARSLFAKYYPDSDFNPSSYSVRSGPTERHRESAPTDLDMLFVLPWDVYNAHRDAHWKQAIPIAPGGPADAARHLPEHRDCRGRAGGRRALPDLQRGHRPRIPFHDGTSVSI